MADETKKKIIDVEINEGDAIQGIENLTKSINNLRKANKSLRDERNKTDTTTEAGRKRIEELNKTIDANDKIIKQNSSSLEKQRLNTGNYASAVDKLNDRMDNLNKRTSGLTDSLDRLVPGFGNVTRGIQAATRASLTFIATPLGAILGAIAIALAAVTRYFKSSEEGQDKLNALTRKFTVTLNVLNDALAELGRLLVGVFENPKQSIIEFSNFIKQFIIDRFNAALGGVKSLGQAFVLLFKGEFQEALDAASSGIKDIVANTNPLALQIQFLNKVYNELGVNIDDINKKLREGAEIEALSATTDRLERELIVRKAILQAEIAEARLRSEDRNLDLEDRIKSLNEALQKQQELGNLETAVANNRFEIKKRENALSLSTKDDLKEQAELEAELFLVRKDTADKSREIFTKEQQLRLEYIKQLREEEEKLANKLLIDFDNTNTTLEAITNRGLKRIAQFRKKQAEEAAKANAAELKATELKEKAITSIVEQSTSKRSVARVALNSIFKQDTLKEVVISTRAAAIAAYKSLAGIPIIGPFLGAAAATAVTIFGLQQAAQISGISFAKGGKVKKSGTFKGPSHAQGGVTYYGSDGQVINVEGGENFYVLKKTASEEINGLSRLNVKHGGRSFGSRTVFAQEGGQIAPLSSQTATLQQVKAIVQTTLENLPPNITLIQDVESALANRNEIKDQATLI